jgi:hypothetical protein
LESKDSQYLDQALQTFVASLPADAVQRID